MLKIDIFSFKWDTAQNMQFYNVVCCSCVVYPIFIQYYEFMKGFGIFNYDSPAKVGSCPGATIRNNTVLGKSDESLKFVSQKK